jgi:prepilin-type N-terminal cleavage/methylation domain-containing protein
MRNKKRSIRGFSLVEMMMAILLLSIISGAVLKQISNIQVRYKTEENRVATVEESREFVDQMVRDLHQMAFPHKRLFALTAAQSGNNAYSLKQVASGLVSVSPTRIQFEADLDGSGTVQEVIYQLVDPTTKNPVSDTSKCPCTLQRGQTVKLDATAPPQTVQPSIFSTEVDNVINPTTEPVFRFFQQDGTEITSGFPINFDNTNSNMAGGAIFNVFTIKISVTVAAPYRDVQTRLKPEVTYTATAEVNN